MSVLADEDQRILRRRARSEEGPRRPAQVRSCYRLYSQPRHFSTDSVLDRTDYSRSYARGAGLHPVGGASNSSVAVWAKICRRSYRLWMPVFTGMTVRVARTF